MKTALIIAATSLLLLGGCVGYPVDYALEIQDSREPVDCPSCGSFLDVMLTWGASANLDLELITPDGTLVHASDQVISGCSHLGDDFGSNHGGVEEIICNAPSWGRYDVRVVNNSDSWGDATVDFQDFEDDGTRQTVSQFTRVVELSPWGTDEILTTL